MPPIKRISVLALILTSVVAVLAELESVENSLLGCASPHQQCLPRVLCAQGEPRGRRDVTGCTASDGVEGICCRPLAHAERVRRSLLHRVPDQLLSNAVREGHRVYARKMVQIEKDHSERKPETVQPSLVHRFHGSPFTRREQGDAVQDQHEAYEDVFVVRSLVEALNLTKEAPELQHGIDVAVDEGKKLHKRCIPPKHCDPAARYRSIDGSCNNPIPERSSWGAAGHPFERLLPPAYEDGVWAPRLHSAVTGRLLPNAREISVVVFPDNDRPDPQFNLLLMQFGQFMSHDFTRSASVRKGHEEVQCCLPDHSGPVHRERAHFACLPITVSPSDPFYSKFGIRIQHRHRRSELVPIQDVFLDPSRLLERSFFDDLLYSLIDQPQQQVDDSITHGLTRLLFAGRHPFGSDLASLNIQRGRDHALRPYNDYREWAGLPRITNFQQFGPVGERLASVYDSPEDVDLWVGGLLEPPAPGGALVGPTFATILSEQFARLKYGDRYYYTNGPQHNPGYFTVGQLQQIGRVSLATVICANIDHPEAFSVPQNVFLHPNEHKNPPVPCRSLPGIELSAWRGH
uniref:Uncharacterized protein n=1 Tax=Anopheles albimanus TaxID=7167 RepID=A0A182FA25_ANOAL